MQFSVRDIHAWAPERERMVETQIRARGIKDARVIEAMRTTPRHLFVSAGMQTHAYDDHPVGIACGQTVSQPYMVAAMTELLALDSAARALEIGTGAGYQTAILAVLAREVVSVERHAPLADAARQRIEALGHQNVVIEVGDGTLGCPERAPYDAILVTAAAPKVPDALKSQLADGGRLVVPVGDRDLQYLTVVVRTGEHYETVQGMSCRFVPLIGAQGWRD